jgi:putative membrane protein
MKRLFLPTLLAAALVIAGCSQNRANPRNESGENQSTAGQDNMGGQNSSPNALNADDKGFAQKAATGGQAEVALGQLASEKATDPKVKEFAQRMVTDHGQANQQLEQIASKKELDLPKMVPTEAQEEHDKLAKLSGAQFDKEYMRFMVKDHQQDAEDFQKAQNEVADPDLKQFATQTLPIIQEHLKMAQQLAGRTK